MKIPKTIKVAGLTFQVELNEKICNEKNQYGYCNLVAGKLQIATQSHKDQQHETLWHEIVEAIDGIYDLHLEHHKISLLGTAIHQVVMDNPELLKD